MNVIKKKFSIYQLAACAAALFLLAVIVLLRSDRLRDEGMPDTLRLWYVEDDYFTSLLQRARDAGLLSGTGTSLSIRSFESEQELANALDSERPEMLWCSGDTAEALSLNGNLSSISDYIGSLPESYSCFSGNAAFEAGEFYPLKLEAEVLVYNPDAIAASDSFESLLLSADASSSDGAVPLLACDSWYSLFEALVSGSGTVLSADRLENSENDDYVTSYNALAELALSGGLYSGDLSPLEVFNNGGCLCCAVLSSELESADVPADYTLCIPASGGCVSAKAFGIAVTAEDTLAAKACAPVIEKLLALDAAPDSCFPVSRSQDDFPAGTEKIVIKGYIPGVETAMLKFDEEISRMLSILCE